MYAVRWLVPVMCLGLPLAAQTTPLPQASPTAGQTAAVDPIAVGKAALRHEDFRSANEFFTRYVQDNPQDNTALFLLGNSQLGLRDFSAAEATFREVLARDPKLWEARANLVLVYSETERWKEFDQLRASIAADRAAHSPNVPDHGVDVIDVFTVNGQRYIARQFTPPEGRFHTKYNFSWFGADGKLAGWIACESDDIDQTFFVKKHPQEAAAGLRSYSLDSYTPRIARPDGTFTQTHGTIRFYEDGEPTYEQVRADVIAVAQHKTGAASSSTIHGASAAAAPGATATSPK